MTQVEPDDLKLPMATIVKLLKGATGDNVNFSTEAKTAIARAAAMFCLHTAEYANELANRNKRSKIVASDVVAALDNMDVPEFQEQVKATLDEYRALVTKNAKK